MMRSIQVMFLLTEWDDNGETVMFAPEEGFYVTPGLGKSECRLAYVLCEDDLRKGIQLLNKGIQAYMNDPDWMEPLGKMGFDIEEFGPNTYAVRAVPTFFGLTEAETFVNDYIDSVNEHTDFTSRDVISGIASRACSDTDAYRHTEARR